MFRVCLLKYLLSILSRIQSNHATLIAMIDEFIESCLPIFRDNSLDDDQRLEQVQRTLSALSTLHGQQLESLTLRVAHLCRERIQAEETLQAASSPLRPPSAPRIQVDRPSRQTSSSIELPGQSELSLPVTRCLRSRSPVGQHVS